MATNEQLATELINSEQKTEEKKELHKQESDAHLPFPLTAGKAKRMEYGICICITKIRDIDMVSGKFFGQGTLHFSWPASEQDCMNFDKDPANYIPTIKPVWRFSNAIESAKELIAYDNGNPWAVLNDEDPNVFGNRVRFIDPKARYNFICYDIFGVFAQQFDVRNFPVDCQDCCIQIESVDKVENVVFREPWDIRYETGAISTAYCSVAGFKLHPLKIELGLLRYVSSFATLCFVGKLERIWFLVFWRLGIFLMLVSLSALFGYVMDPLDEIDGRLAHQFVIILTLVAFQFVLSSELPQTSYLTYMDVYSLTCFMYVMLVTVLQSIVAVFELSRHADWILFWVSAGIWLFFHLSFAIRMIVKKKLEMKKLNLVPAEYAQAGFPPSIGHGNYWNVFAFKCFWPDDYPIGPTKIPKERADAK